MPDTASAPGVGSSVPRQSAHSASSRTAWTGWGMFAATMLILIGTFHIIQGLMAIFDDEYYLVTKNGLSVQLDYTAWGWTHLIAGAVVALAGVCLTLGQTWARVVGVAVAAISALINFAFIAAYPFWSVIVIALDVFVILALTVHGRDLKSA